MNKTVKIIIAVAVVVAAVVAVLVGVLAFGGSKSSLNITSLDELTALVDQIYAGVSIEMPMLQTMPLENVDPDMLSMYTGLENGENVEYIVVSEPMMSAQAYSLVLVKVKDGVDADTVAKTINENVDERKWICVTAEKVYTAASGNVVCLVMSNADTAKTVYDSFKKVAGSVGQEYERTAEEPELPEDMLIDGPAIDDEPAAMPGDETPVDDQPAAMPEETPVEDQPTDVVE